MWTATLRGPAGGPAAIEVCLLTPAEASRRPPLSVLSAREKALMSHRDGRGARADFVAGRVAAHALLGPGLEVLAGRHGEPVPARGGRRVHGVRISISHSHGFGMAGALREPGWSIGVDLEARGAMSARLSRSVLTETERRRARRQGAESSGRGSLAHWALKEAALKALGGEISVGMLREPGAVEVTRFGRDGWCRLSLRGGVRGIGVVLVRPPGLTMAVALIPL